MTFNETAVIVLGLFGGYWVIDALLNKSSTCKNNNHTNSQTDVIKSSADRHDGDYEEYIANNWHSILGITKDADMEQISAAYQQLLAECHSDKVAHMDEEFRELAAFKLKKIKDAHDFGMSRAR